MTTRNTWARYEPFLRYKTVSTGAFPAGGGNTCIVADTEVAGNSIIIFSETQTPAGNWAITSQTAGTGFTITSTDSESGTTFNYIIL
jgi:hypothetical protein